MSSLPLAMLRTRGSFSADSRFAGFGAGAPLPPLPAEPDAVAEAYSRGFADGSAQTLEAALEIERERDAAREAIELAFARFDEASAAQLRDKLRQTVLALCEQSILPLALDSEALVERIEVAVGRLQRSHDDRRLLLNPADLELIRARLPAELRVEGDESVERGALRVETPDGGMEDGPSQWRRILAEAFREC